MSELAVDGLRVTLDGRLVVRDASLRLARGELVALLGANGAGRRRCCAVRSASRRVPGAR